jgi:poly-gamma-glutamate synthesis protein (capsule biosynthesis protein)
MTGRGVDQILPHPCDPRLHESYMDSAIDYVRLVEQVVGPMPRASGIPSFLDGSVDGVERLLF